MTTRGGRFALGHGSASTLAPHAHLPRTQVPGSAGEVSGHANVETTASYDRRPEQAKRKAAPLLHVLYRRRTLASEDQEQDEQ